MERMQNGLTNFKLDRPTKRVTFVTTLNVSNSDTYGYQNKHYSASFKDVKYFTKVYLEKKRIIPTIDFRMNFSLM